MTDDSISLCAGAGESPSGRHRTDMNGAPMVKKCYKGGVPSVIEFEVFLYGYIINIRCGGIKDEGTCSNNVSLGTSLMCSIVCCPLAYQLR